MQTINSHPGSLQAAVQAMSPDTDYLPGVEIKSIAEIQCPSSMSSAVKVPGESLFCI